MSSSLQPTRVAGATENSAAQSPNTLAAFMSPMTAALLSARASIRIRRHGRYSSNFLSSSKHIRSIGLSSDRLIRPPSYRLGRQTVDHGTSRKWCGRPDLNRQGRSRGILSPLCLPISPRPHYIRVCFLAFFHQSPNPTFPKTITSQCSLLE